jgi:hypothetical protein
MWQQRIKELSSVESRELSSIRGFLEDHPAYNAVYPDSSGEIDSVLAVDGLTLEDLIDLTRSELQRLLMAATEAP